MTRDTVTITLGADEETDELVVPTAVIDALRDEGESIPEVVGDIAMLGLAQQAHGLVHHGTGTVDPDLEAAETLAMDLFEERFGQTFAEITGHGH